MRALKIVANLVFVLAVSVFIYYLVLPQPTFPEPPPGVFRSTEPADIEDPLRRAYFTNLNRAEVLKHYQDEFEIFMFGVKLPNYRLNYPPEEAQTLIRDQTRSTYLEEIVHPFRESLFVNGYEPGVELDTLIADGVQWPQKFIVKYITSSQHLRLLIAVPTAIVTYLLVYQWSGALKGFFVRVRKIKWTLR